jgi:hypothetical protein
MEVMALPQADPDGAVRSLAIVIGNNREYGLISLCCSALWCASRSMKVRTFAERWSRCGSIAFIANSTDRCSGNRRYLLLPGTALIVALMAALLLKMPDRLETGGVH